MKRQSLCRAFAWTGAVLLGLALGLPPGTAGAAEPAELAREAAGGPTVIWYESSKEDQADKIVAAFNRRYPDVKVQHVRVVGGNNTAGRVVSEVQARGYSADLVTTGSSGIWALDDRGLLLRTDWSELGISGTLTPTPFAVAIAASVYVILYNSDRVSAAEAPKGWDDMLDGKWRGRTGSWVRAGAFAQMAKTWGEADAEAKLREFTALKPFLFKSTYPLAQQVAAGEVDVALGFFHTAQPPIKAGAPLKLVALDPSPMHTIYSGVTKDARNPAGAKLLLAWLTTAEGAAAYEAATNRGSHLLQGTRTQALVAGARASEYPPEETDAYKVVAKRFNEILGSAGAAR